MQEFRKKAGNWKLACLRVVDDIYVMLSLCSLEFFMTDEDGIQTEFKRFS